MRIAIVAMGATKTEFIGPASIAGTPYGMWDEVWTLNGLCGVLRADRYFMLDDFGIQEGRAEWNGYVRGMLKTAREASNTIITTRAVDGYPDLQEYPLQYVVDQLGLRRMYFSNSVPYMVALALAEGATKIGVYGCDYTYNGGKNTENGRACLEWWLGFAEARGVEVVLPASTTLMDGGRDQTYGYWCEDVILGGGKVARTMRANPPSAREVEATMSHTRGAK
jgi:hypothetical protein